MEQEHKLLKFILGKLIFYGVLLKWNKILYGRIREARGVIQQ